MRGSIAARLIAVREKHGGRAGFYACTSFAGQRSPVMGEMFDGATLAELARSLKGAGAVSVENRVLARTPRPG